MSVIGSAVTSLSFALDESLAAELDEMTREASEDFVEILRSGLSVMKAFREQRKLGRRHLGFVSDPMSLDVEMVGLPKSKGIEE
jgi:hypothetical protein